MAPYEKKAPTSLSPKDLFGDDGSAAGPGGPTITLRVESGTHVGKGATLGPSGGTMGRSSKCQLCLKGAPGVSRRHGQIVLRGETFYVVDTESRNGIVVNGVEIAGETPLGDQDLIELSDEHIRVTLGYSDQIPASPTDVMSAGATEHRSDLSQTRPPAQARMPPGPVPTPVVDPPGPSVGGEPPLGLDAAAALLAPSSPANPQVPDSLIESDPGPPNTGPADRAPPLGTDPNYGSASGSGALGVGGLPPAVDPQMGGLGAPAPELPAESLMPLHGHDADEPVVVDGHADFEPIGVPDEGTMPSASRAPSGLGPSELDGTVTTGKGAKKRGSFGMFVVGSFLGLTIVLVGFGGWDALMNEGKLRTELHTKANAFLADYDVQIPTFDEMLGWLDGDDAATGIADGGAPASTDAGPGVATTGAPTTTDAGAPAAVAEPTVFKAPGQLLVSVVVEAGPVTAKDRLVGFHLGKKADLKRKLALEKERDALKKKKKTKKNKKRLKKVSQELFGLFGSKKIKPASIRAPTAGKVSDVKVRSGQIVEAETPLLTFEPG